MNIQKWLRIAFWLLLGTILALSIMPAEDAPTVFANDKLNHALAFFTLSLMARMLWSRAHFAMLIGLLALFGGGIELLQWAMGFGRDADWMDFAADIAAILAGIWAGAMVSGRKAKASVPDQLP